MDKKPLHITDNIEALDEVSKTQNKAILKCKNVSTLSNLASKLYKEIHSESQGDETTYIYCRRYLVVMEQMSRVQNDENFILIRYEREIRLVKELTQTLRNQLIERYNLIANKNNENNNNSNNNKSTDDVKDSTSRLFLNVFITCKELYVSMENTTLNLLFIDVRPADDYKNCKIIYKNVINIPENIIVPGLSANKLGQNLPVESVPMWEKRDSYSALVLMDWDSTPQTICRSKLDLLRSIIVEWDYNRDYAHDPIMLNGGLEEFVDTYPSRVLNPHVGLLRKDSFLDDLLNIDDEDYEDSVQSLTKDNTDENFTEATGSSTSDSSISEIIKPEETQILPSDYGDIVEPDVSNQKKEIPDKDKILKDARKLKPITIKKPEPPKINRSNKPSLVDIKEFGTVGIKNINNSCYMNTAIQCFRTLPIIKAFFLSDQYKHYQKKARPAILEETAYLVKALWSDKLVSIAPLQFRDKIIQLDSMYGCGNHEDSMEFFLFLLNHLVEDCQTVKAKKADNISAREEAMFTQLQGRSSIFIDYFYYQIRNDKICDGCGTSSSTYETDSTIMLPVPANDCHLDDLLEEYFKDYQISGFNCTNCKNSLRLSKKVVYAPPVLVIVLKRYFQGTNPNDLSKNRVMVDFRLDKLQVGKSFYRLTGIALHSGTLKNGHYTAGCLINNNWMECNDDYVGNFVINGFRTKSLVCAFFYSQA